MDPWRRPGSETVPDVRRLLLCSLPLVRPLPRPPTLMDVAKRSAIISGLELSLRRGRKAGAVVQ